MNRRSIMIASALFLSVGATRVIAQEMVPHPSFGLLAGADFAEIKGDGDTGESARTGFVGGISMKVHVARHFFVEADALYSQEGAKLDEDGDDATLKLDYIRVPVQLGFRFPTHTSVHPFVAVGPSFGFKVGCKETSGSTSANCDEEGADVRSFDFAGVASAGLGFRVGKEELSIQARYTHGFNNIVKDSEGSGSDKNQNWAVLAGFAF